MANCVWQYVTDPRLSNKYFVVKCAAGVKIFPLADTEHYWLFCPYCGKPIRFSSQSDAKVDA
jgi:hypothetical protein